MPYVVKEARRLTLLCADMPDPSPELKDAVNDLLRLMKHPLAVPLDSIVDTYSVRDGEIAASKSSASYWRPRKPTDAETLIEAE